MSDLRGVIAENDRLIAEGQRALDRLRRAPDDPDARREADEITDRLRERNDVLQAALEADEGMAAFMADRAEDVN